MSSNREPTSEYEHALAEELRLAYKKRFGHWPEGHSKPSRPDLYKGNYEVVIALDDSYWFTTWTAHVTKGVMKIGWAWAFSQEGAKKKASKIIQRHKAENAEPKITLEYEVAE